MHDSLQSFLRRSCFQICLVAIALSFFLANDRATLAQTVMNDGQVYEEIDVEANEWIHYRIFVNDWHSDFQLTMTVLRGNPDIYVRKGAQPTLNQWDFRPYENQGDETVQISNSTTIQLDSGWYYISVHTRPSHLLGDMNGDGIFDNTDISAFVLALTDPVSFASLYPDVDVVIAGDFNGDGSFDNTDILGFVNALTGGGSTPNLHSYQLVAQRSINASNQSGMGAIPYDGGTAFRVWAPNADSVNVAGEFNGWSTLNADMVDEGNGNWSIDHRNAVPGQQYKYVIRNSGQTIWKVDPREEQITSSVGNSVIFDDDFDWNDGSYTMPNWNELVIYEMHVGTLNDTPGGAPGTFDSAIGRLDHIRDLGINAVKIMPVNEFPGDFSWGYNPSHPFTVETAYGGPRELKRFVDEAHSRGIAVMIDLVHNHWGPTDMELWQFDGYADGTWGGIYFYEDERSVTPWGDTRPNYETGEVRQYIRDNVMMWLEDFHIDGLRIDSTLNIRTHIWGDNPDGWSLLQWINDEINASQPWKFSVAEDLQNNSWITKDTNDQGGAGFDAQWDAGFVHPIRDALQAVNDNDRNMWSVRDAINQQYNGDVFERIIYTESHDEVANGRARVPEDIWPGNADSWVSQKRSTLGAALVMTSPGVPMIFQGQEVLEDEYFQDTDPVDWSKEVTHAGIEQLYTDLIRLRRNWFDNTRGLRGQNKNVFHVNNNNNDKLVAFHRWDQGGVGDDVVIVCNFANNTKTNYRIGFPSAGTWKVRFNSDWDGYSPDFGNHFTPDVTTDGTNWDGFNQSGIITVAPYSAVILSQ